MNEQSTVTILYHQNHLCNFNRTASTTFNDIRNSLAQKYQLDPLLITLMSDKSVTVNDYDQLLNTLQTDSNGAIELTLNAIGTKVSFCQMDNEDNCFAFDYDLVTITIPSFKDSVFSFFKAKMDEFNYKITQYEFYANETEKSIFFSHEGKAHSFTSYFASNEMKDIKFYFLIKNQAISFYKAILPSIIPNPSQTEDNPSKIVLRKDVANGEAFSIVIQTYNHLIKEISVYPEMTIGELKEKIEEAFLVRKEYQELLYLVYKLKDDSKTIKDFYIRPQGVIFLRGFFFPVIFVDFYQKSNKNVISINIAERISFVKGEVAAKLGLESNYDYKLICNGKEMNDNYFLIDYNVQRMQMIYFK